MLRDYSRFALGGVLVGLLGLGLVAVACGGGEQSESAGQEAIEQQRQQESVETRPAAQPESRQQSASEADQPEPAEQEQHLRSNSAASGQPSQSSESAADSASQQSDGQRQAETQNATQSTAQAQQAAEEVDAESVPEGTRLISLFGDITEIVYALGVEEILVARDASSIYPPEAEALPNLGFAGGLNAEAILDFEPTLVIGSPLAGPPGVLEQLVQAGVDVLIIEPLKGLDAPQIKIRLIGETLGVPLRAEALALDVEQRMQAVVAASANDDPLRVLHVYIRRGGLQLVSGQGNEAQTIIEAAGAIDAAAEAGIAGWQPLTPEALVAADPDVYLVMDRGLAVVGGIEGLLAIPGMAETKAGRGQHVISMPDLYLLGFGPRLPEAIADLAQFLSEIQAQTEVSE